MEQPKYQLVDMTLGDVIRVLTDHRVTFPELRGMKMGELDEALERVNNGQLITYAEAAKRDAEKKKGPPKR